MSGNIVVVLDDRKRTPECKTFYEKDEVLLNQLNSEGWGIFWAVNEFNVSEEEMKAKGFKTKRNDGLCSNLRFVYSDLDIAKAGDGQTREIKQQKKMDLYAALLEKCEPSKIIETSNGLQPLWKLKPQKISESLKIQYKKVIKGVIKWSKTFNCKADGVFDTTRILRFPNYYHQKEEPFLCQVNYESKKTYSLDELEKLFPFEEKQIVIQQLANINSNPVFEAIGQINFQELIIRAFASVGRPVSFDKSGHLIDPVGKTTGTFLGRNGNRDYLASSSHEPFRGNRITAIADILKIDYSDAYKWICKEYNLDFKKLIKENKIKEQIKTLEIKKKLDKTKRYTWGTRYLDTHFAIIKPTNFIVIAARRNSGKTTYTFDIACKNAKLGHKTLYLSLEMDTDDILDDFGRKYSGITIEEEFDKKIPDHKQLAYNHRKNELTTIPNLILEGIRRSGNIEWETIVEIIKKHEKTDMIFIDNLDLIAGKDGEKDWDRQKRLVKQMMAFTADNHIPIILVHHYRKSNSNKDFGMDEMTGSGKIADGADRVLKVVRCSDPNAEYPEKYKSTIYLQKGRGYPETSASVYFIKSEFVDNPFDNESKDKNQIDIEF